MPSLGTIQNPIAASSAPNIETMHAPVTLNLWETAPAPKGGHPNPMQHFQELTLKYAGGQREPLPSIEKYRDPLSIARKIAEINDLIDIANTLCHKPSILKLIPSEAIQLFQLYKEIVDKNGMLGACLLLNGVESPYRSTSLRFTRWAHELRHAMSNLQEPDPTARVWSHYQINALHCDLELEGDNPTPYQSHPNPTQCT